MRTLLLVSLLLGKLGLCAQAYDTYFTGNPADAATTPRGGVCLMGGATEHDGAMRWFLDRADGGDVLVLRASGSDGYNDYFYTELGVTLNSVETIVFNHAAADQAYVQDRIRRAEAIWLAGGDQWDYVSYWRGTAIDSLINDAIRRRNVVVGGTSAGMAILGGYYFSAENGTVTSAAALADPYDARVRVDSAAFLRVDHLRHVITDTHYDAPDRRGRHVAFLARALTDYGAPVYGIACNEYTAVCVDENGLARVYGEYPTYPETAYFLRVNCGETDNVPERLSPGQPLDWRASGRAVKVYKVFGTDDGANTFDLSDWQTGSGGVWEDWSVDNGTLNVVAGDQPDCAAVSIRDLPGAPAVRVTHLPAARTLRIETTAEVLSVVLYDASGRSVPHHCNAQKTEVTYGGSAPAAGVCFLGVRTTGGMVYHKFLRTT